MVNMKRQFSLLVLVVLLGSGTAFAGSGTPESSRNNNPLVSDTMISKQSGFERKTVAGGFTPHFPQWEASFRKITAFDEAAFDQYNLRLQQVLKEGANEKMRNNRQEEKKRKQAFKGLLLSYDAAGKWS